MARAMLLPVVVCVVLAGYATGTVAVEGTDTAGSASGNGATEAGDSGERGGQSFMTEGDPRELEPDELQSEIGVLRAVGEGLLLVLAACEDEPHCVTGVAEREIRSLLMEIERRIAVLEGEQGLSPEHGRILSGYIELRELFGRVADQFISVRDTVEVEELEGHWSDHFAEDNLIEGADKLDFLNEHVTLERFEDVDEPLPIY